MVLFICTIFIVSLSLIDDVSAAKWKKYDSAKYTDNYPPAGYKKTAKYQSYTNGENKLYANFYNFKKGTNKKYLNTKLTITKKKNTVKVVGVDDYGKKVTYYFKTKDSVKKVYKSLRNGSLRLLKISPEKLAFDKKTAIFNGKKLKLYGISPFDNYIIVYGYVSNEEIMTIMLTKSNGKITMESYDNNRKRTYKTSFKSNSSLKSVYNVFISEFLKESAG